MSKVQPPKKYPYTRMHHFRHWLGKFQDNPNIKIPQEVLDKITNELPNYSINDPKKVDDRTIRRIIRDYKMWQHFDDVTRIKN